EFHKRGLAGELIEVDEDLWIKDDGTEYWLRWSIAPWFETTGTIGGIIIATENITPQKKAENNLRLLNIELEERVAERTQQLTAVNKELEAFSYSISHDLRAPLRGIDGFTRILTEEYSDHLDDEGKRLCSVIRENTLKMSKLIEDLLAFSKLGKKELNISVIRMDNMVNSIFHEITTPGERERITMKIQNLHDSQGDTNMMRQVWANLLSNAVKFTSKKPDPVIEISSETETNRTIYHVKDNGAGFDMKYASKLFGVFQRLHLLSDFEGTGVGLATVQRIINKHGGQIWAVGKVNEGATFSFSLPSVINE
ncbi:MAG TPA: ATP-binding protein, partial [Bacteroidales bacterium]|nr:ATP-binding protein [Bacteroidales bacterium]